MSSCNQAQPTEIVIEEAFRKINNEKLWKELEEMVRNDQYYRKKIKNLDKESNQYQKQWDSIWQLQLVIDHKNTKRIIEITEKYGFPDPRRTGKPISVWLLLHHSPREYHEEIKSLIDREYNSKRMDSTTYGMLKWHVNGRKGYPEGTGLQIIDNR